MGLRPPVQLEEHLAVRFNAYSEAMPSQTLSCRRRLSLVVGLLLFGSAALGPAQSAAAPVRSPKSVKTGVRTQITLPLELLGGPWLVTQIRFAADRLVVSLASANGEAAPAELTIAAPPAALRRLLRPGQQLNLTRRDHPQTGPRFELEVLSREGSPLALLATGVGSVRSWKTFDITLEGPAQPGAIRLSTSLASTMLGSSREVRLGSSRGTFCVALLALNTGAAQPFAGQDAWWKADLFLRRCAP